MSPIVSDAPRRRLSESPKVLFISGITLIVVVVLAIVMTFEAFSGHLSSTVKVSAQLPAAGNAVQPGDRVEYLDVPVGTVASGERLSADGQALVDLKLQPSKVDVIPANVHAIVAPLSIFGNQYVDLIAPSTPSGHLQAGQMIEASTTEPSGSLQDTLSDLYDVLRAVHPAQLDSALSAVATALQGHGAQIGTAIGQVDGYLRMLQPDLPTLIDDIRLTSTTADALLSSVRPLQDALRNLTTTANTIVDKQHGLATTLTAGSTFADQLSTLLENTTASYTQVVASIEPLLTSLDRNPTSLMAITKGLSAWTKSWASAVGPGPYIHFTVLLPVPDPYTFLFAAAGGPTGKALADQAFRRSLDPKPYSAKDCPRYGSLAGSNCPTGSSKSSRAKATGHATKAGAPASLVPTPAAPPSSPQENAIARILHGLGLNVDHTSAAIGSLLLGPVIADAGGQR
jgi:phospholipid/cholesterol/gamma-HCH transport system substrate-binding protein